ncbi:MarR family EPS-associated transcriptional regulator [Candidatus Omnitrophota bacterium]
MDYLKEKLKLLNHIQKNPKATQRELMSELDISLGKVNFLIKILVEKGIVKLEKFKNSRKKIAYLYLITPTGIKQKAEITKKFLEKELGEFDRLRGEIERLRTQVETANTDE